SFLANDLFGQGRSVTIGASEWPMFGGSLAPPPTASTLPLASKQFMISVGNAVKSRVYMTNHNGEVESWWVGATVSIAGNIRTITAVNVDKNGQNNNFDLNADLPDGLFPGRA